MKLPTPALLLLVAFASGSLVDASSASGTRFLRQRSQDTAIEDSGTVPKYSFSYNTPEDESYWNRLMQETDMSVAPTNPPPSPTPAPPSEAPPPTEPATTEAPPTPTEPLPTEASPTEPPPTGSSPTGSAPSEVPTTESPPTGAPPTGSPPSETTSTEAAPTEVPPTENPSTGVPPTEAIPVPQPTDEPLTPPPTPPPTATETPPPTIAPVSIEPPLSECEISLEVECLTADGIACEEGLIVSPDPQEITFNFTLTNIGTVNALPRTIISNFTFENFNLNATVNLRGVVIEPGDTYEINFPVTNITLGEEGLNFNVESVAIADNPEGSECSAFDQTSFSLGPSSPPPSATPPPLTPDPTPAPTEEPSPAPTSPPLTPDPTPAPTEEPGPAPTPPFLTDCELGLLVECFSSDGRTCEEAFPPTAQCDSPPTSISIKYLGGDCLQSATQQMFQCTDTSGGPDMTSSVYIEARNDRGVNVFSGAVDVGGVFSLQDGGETLGSSVTITIFDDEASQNILQEVTFASSCAASALIVNEIFGASQVVGWINQEGVVESTIPQTFTFNYTISNEGRVEVDLQRLVSNFTEGFFTFSQEINFDNLAVSPGESLPPLTINVQPVALDDGRKSFIIESEVFALDPAGVECTELDESEFFFGYLQPGETFNS